MHYILFYRFVKDSKTVKLPFRNDHLKFAWNANARGELILGGALGNPEDEAMLLFKADSPDIVADFARNDPYVINGVVAEWRVRPWTTVVGEDACTIIRPT
ncbi:YciI-like protein [Herbaspirillum sp. RV1423]|uniref:YciI-like protein n=1 Tax=Herbaspirillum sp. RV1423 TaxID=1443993 RepID=UPI0004BC2BA6|nr:YciI-like protein [Herbaspirillum sp. RV1423]